jgi:hypothetical protein
LLVNAVNDVGAPGTLAVVTLPFIRLLAMLNVPLVSAAVGVAKYPTSVTEAADGLMSHAVVMLTDDGKSFVAPSVIVAMLCVPPEFTVTVNDEDFTALKETVAVFDVSPACAEAFAVTIASAATATGRVRSRIIQAVPERG